MNKASRAYYGLVFERNYLKMRGSEFQSFFTDLMEKCYPEGDFIRVRPWGKAGDQKNDGYLRSKRILFQVYAPNEMKEADALRKIDDDFNGALPYWKEHFNTWVFMHNAWAGLSPGITKKLLDLDEANVEITVKPWGMEDLKKELFQLSEENIQDLLGHAPSMRDFLKLGFEDLTPILDQITRQPAPNTPDLRQVPRDKIAINSLSDDVETLINAGRRKSILVKKFFEQYPHPEYGDQVVRAFQTKYETLKDEGCVPDEIFMKLQIYAGGELTLDPKHQAAVLSVLAYLFDECDIFERE